MFSVQNAVETLVCSLFSVAVVFSVKKVFSLGGEGILVGSTHGVSMRVCEGGVASPVPNIPYFFSLRGRLPGAIAEKKGWVLQGRVVTPL